MDNLAKAYWNLLKTAKPDSQPPQFSVQNEGWTIYHGTKELVTSHRRELYPILADPEALTY